MWSFECWSRCTCTDHCNHWLSLFLLLSSLYLYYITKQTAFILKDIGNCTSPEVHGIAIRSPGDWQIENEGEDKVEDEDEN